MKKTIFYFASLVIVLIYSGIAYIQVSDLVSAFMAGVPLAVIMYYLTPSIMHWLSNLNKK